MAARIMADYTCLLFILQALLLVVPVVSKCQKNRPIVIVPGAMGSQLEARLHKSSGHLYCSRKYEEWYRLWLDLDDLLPIVQNCFKDNIKLHYNISTGQYSNTAGVDIRVVDFGNTTGIETLDPNIKSASYFDVLVEYFVKRGYSRGVDLRAAPFDWRLGPVELTERGYFNQLQKLIESTYRAQGNCSVVLLAHSMGAVVSHYFLTQVIDQSWKDMYLNQYITLGGVWAGCSRSLRALVSGDTDEIFKMSLNIAVRPIERSFPSDYWLLPLPTNTAWNKSVTVVATPTKSYTAWDIPSLIQDLKYPNGQSMYEGVMKVINRKIPPPNITTHCLYGVNLKTEETYKYSSHSFPNGKPDVSLGLGDGTVNLQSLQFCNEWVGQQEKPVKSYRLKGADHFGMLDDVNVLKILEQLIIKQ